VNVPILVETMGSYISMKTGVPGHEVRQVPLHEALADWVIQPKDQLRLIDYAISRIESKVRSDIVEVGRATDAHQLIPIIKSSMMLQMLVEGYPDLQGEFGNLVDDITSESITQQLVNRYNSHLIAFGGLALILLEGSKLFAEKVLKKSDSLPGALMIALDPVIKGFAKAAMTLYMADVVYRSRELYYQYESHQLSQDLFYSGADTIGFMTFSEFTADNLNYELTKWSFFAEQAGNALIAYFGFVRPLIPKIGAKKAEEIARDILAFRRLGQEPGNWESVMSLRLGSDPEKNQAIQRLQARYREGRTWDPSILSRTDGSGGSR
jgi:hypothetical protein